MDWVAHMFRAIRFASLCCACIVGFSSFSLAEDEQATDEAAAHAEAHAADHESDAAHGTADGDGHDAHGATGHGATEHGATGHAETGHGDAGHAEHGDGHGSHGNTHPLSVDPDLAIFTILAFGLTYVVLSKFAWKPIRAAPRPT